MGNEHFIPEHLDREQAATTVRSRISALESDLVNVTIDVEAAGPGGNPAQEDRAKQLEASIAKLEAWAKALDAAAKSSTPSTPSG